MNGYIAAEAGMKSISHLVAVQEVLFHQAAVNGKLQLKTQSGGKGLGTTMAHDFLGQIYAVTLVGMGRASPQVRRLQTPSVDCDKSDSLLFRGRQCDPKSLSFLC